MKTISLAEIPDRFYIENQVRLMIENPAPAYRRAQELAQRSGRQLFNPIHIAEVVPLPPELSRKLRSRNRLVLVANLIMAAPWIALIVSAFNHAQYGEFGKSVGNWPFIWRSAIAAFFGWLHYVLATAFYSEFCEPVRRSISEFRTRCRQVIDQMANEFN